MHQLLGETTIEKIRAYYTEGEEVVRLSDKEEKIRKRIYSAYLFLMDMQVATEKSVVQKLVNTFHISTTQAYLDVRNAQLVFGDLKKANKELLRHVVTQFALDLLKKAALKGDYGIVSKSLDKIIRANHLNIDDPDLPDPSKIQPPVQLLSINFNFIDTPWFQKIDPTAQQVLIELRDQFIAKVEKSPASDYLNLFATKPALPDSDSD